MFVFTFCLFVVFGVIDGGKVLLLPVFGVSHINELNAVGEELRDMGHQVYQVMPNNFIDDVKKVSRPGMKAIKFRNDESFNMFSSLLEKKDLGSFGSVSKLVGALNTECREMVIDKEFLKEIKEMNIDFVIVDGFLLAPCRFIVPYHLNIPYAYLSIFTGEWMTRVPYLPSFVPAFSFFDKVHMSDKMNFSDRLMNLMMMTLNQFILPPPFITDTSLLDDYAPGLSWHDVIRKSQLFLITRDHMLEWPSVSMPNVINVPGITIRPAKPLNKDIEALYAEAKHGVVLVSFGSVGGDFDSSAYDRMFDAFGRIKETVLMRYVKKDMEEAQVKAPRNVKLLGWMPQNDMLGHNKTKAFVTHCGNNGQSESLYHGVPMIGAPLFAEQRHNAFRIVAHEYGVKIDNIQTASAQEIYEALSEVLSNDKYTKKCQHASAIIKSDPMIPKKKLAFWVDHVMKFGGDHLRSSALDMPLVTFLMIDIFVFLFVVFILFLLCFYLIFRYFCKSKGQKEKSE